MVDGITPHKSPLFKRGRNVVAEVILPHFWVRPFCVVVSSLLWNPEVPGSNLGTVGTYLVLGTSYYCTAKCIQTSKVSQTWSEHVLRISQLHFHTVLYRGQVCAGHAYHTPPHFQSGQLAAP